MSPYFFDTKGEDMKIVSKITGKTYSPGINVVYLSNMKQAQLYMRNGAELLDILYYQFPIVRVLALLFHFLSLLSILQMKVFHPCSLTFICNIS